MGYGKKGGSGLSGLVDVKEDEKDEEGVSIALSLLLVLA